MPPPVTMTIELKIEEGSVPRDIAGWYGRLMVVWLRRGEDVVEHHGHPAIVVYYGYKLKTTAHPTRIELEHVERWALWPSA